MRSAVILFLAITLVAGCKKSDPDMGTPAPTATATRVPQGGGNSGGVAPMGSGAAGGLTPMTGTESVEGSGSGVGASAMDAARRAAAASSAPAGMGGGASTDTGG